MATMCKSCLSYKCRCAVREPEPAPTCTETLALFDWPTTPPTNGTATSQAAADSLSAEVLSDQQRTILRAMWSTFRDCGATDEMIQQTTGLSGNAERPRRGELVEAGWLETRTNDYGQPETHPTASGRQAVVWFLSDKAVRAVEAWRERKKGRAA